MIRRFSTLDCRKRQRGAAAVLLLLFIGAVAALAAFSSDGVRMTADAAQLKRATDAAALAAAMAYVSDNEADLQEVADRYVRANLGMDSAQTANELTVGVEVTTYQGDPAVRVSATFEADSLLRGAGPVDVSVASTAAARNKSLEVALILPNTAKEDSANLAALRRIGNEFAENLIGATENTWLSLVPHSQAVNVYDAENTGRVRSWASAGALNPVELTSLFRSTLNGSNMADRRIPDRYYNLLCMYRGLNRGDNYFWDEAPSGQFQIYYRADLPVNVPQYPYYISWVGPNPTFGQATGANDTRYMVGDKGCPKAAVLPLTNDLGKISERLDEMDTGYNVNYAIALGWAGMALAPSFRGSAGWALDEDLPKDFDDGEGDRTKAIVMLVNSSDMDWFDSDAYNAYVGEAVDGCPSDGSSCSSSSLITDRFSQLCSSFRARNLRFFMIVTGTDESESGEDGNLSNASAFRRVAGAGLATCAEQSSDITYYQGADFVASEDKFKSRLEDIVETLRQQSNAVWLVE